MQLYPQETPHAASRVEGKAKVITPPGSRASFGALEAPVLNGDFLATHMRTMVLVYLAT